MDVSPGVFDDSDWLARWLRPGVLVLIVEGELDMLGAPDLTRRIRDAARLRPAHIGVDLAGVTFLGSSGLAVLVTACQDPAQAGIQLHLIVTRGNRIVERPLSRTGVKNLFPVHADVEAFLGFLDHAGSDPT